MEISVELNLSELCKLREMLAHALTEIHFNSKIDSFWLWILIFCQVVYIKIPFFF